MPCGDAGCPKLGVSSASAVTRTEASEHSVDEVEHRTGGAVGRKILRAAGATRGSE